MRDPAELAINEGGVPVTRPAPSTGLIADFQRRFGLALPDDYVALLKYANGGHPELDAFSLINRPGAGNWTVNEFYYLTNDKTSPSSLWKATEIWQQVLGNRVLPFAQDGMGNQFLLDFVATAPVVTACVHDEGFRVVNLAPSFGLFIDGLSIDPEII